MQGNNSFRYMIRIIAGIYLLYLAWNLIGGLRSGETSGIAFVIGSGVFIVAGVFFIVDALNNIRREALENRAENAAEENTEQENDTLPVSGETSSKNASGDGQDPKE